MNLKSTTTHIFYKISLSIAYVLLHNLDVVCISERYLDSTTECNGNNPEIARYNLIRADKAYNSEIGGVFIFYKRSLVLRLIDVHYLKE